MKMKARCIWLALVLLPLWVEGQRFVWQDTTLALDARVEWIVQNLTLDEKLSLMVHQNPAIERIGLPAYSWWNEALHGVGRAGKATVYPMPIALAATFDPQLVRDVFGNVAAEARRKHFEAADTGNRGDYTGLTFFTPNINIFRDPRWGRGMETYGEDPYLTAVMGLACVEGLQGGGTAACLKHLAVHSGPEGVRHEFDSRVSDRDLRTTYLPAFEYIVKNSRVAQVMCGYNRLNGEPCCTNNELLTEILRREWNFDGILVTDCWALNDAYERDTVIPRHKTHPSAALAYGDAFGREVDLECGSGLPALRDAVRYGYVPESKVDEHVRRLLRTRLALTGFSGKSEIAAPPAAVSVAARSMVLLKNNGALPLRELPNIILAGPNANDSLMPLGNYNGTPEHCVTIGEALSEPIEKSVISSEWPTVIYAGGLSPQLEGEELQVEMDGFYRGDRTRIELPQYQVDEIKAFKSKGYNVVLLLCTGSAIALENVVDYCDAVVVCWYGGQDMGTAVRQLLYGERDDFGRLPVTFYRSTAQLPDFESYDMGGRTYRYMDSQPLFAFGYGLSYSSYKIGEAGLLYDGENLWVDANVVLDSTRVPGLAEHRTVLQFYLTNLDDPEGPRRSLVGVQPLVFEHVKQLREVHYKIDPFWLRRYNPATSRMESPHKGSRMVLEIGFSSDDKDTRIFPFTY